MTGLEPDFCHTSVCGLGNKGLKDSIMRENCATILCQCQDLSTVSYIRDAM